MKDVDVDRLAVLTVSGSQSLQLMKELNRADFRFTLIESSGGVLQEAEKILLVGFHSSRSSALLDIVRWNCRPHRQYIPATGPLSAEPSSVPMVEAKLGGALIYLLNVELFEQI